MSKKITDLTAATTPLSGSEWVEIVQSGVSKKVSASYIAGGGGSGRELLIAARSYYVRTDGSDSNNGLSNDSGGAFLTIQKAVDVVSGTLDMSIYEVSIYCNDATRTEQVVFKRYVGSVAPTIIGNSSTPANCIISTTSASCFTNSSFMPCSVNGFKFTTTTSGNGLVSDGAGSNITFSNVDFGSCAGSHIRATNYSVIAAATNYTISGGASSHYETNEHGNYWYSGKTVTLTGTPNFTVAFHYARKGHCICNSVTFSGSATGARINLNLCSTVFSNGGAEATYYPGNSAGSKNTGSEWF